ncbi:MAG: ABC transporter substrate-binding protein, partial [Cyanobacteria bacterium]|nr:ABC transporter substrate-binding protein [Cyanobacteriota bacterium]
MSRIVRFSSRRQFLQLATMAAIATPLIKGCAGNPPSDTASPSPAASPTPSPVVGEGDKPEVTKVTLGFLPIVESAPLIIAKEKGFFAKYGLTEAVVAKQANWPSARDNVVIGSERGGIDGGQWQMPMPYLISEGIITDGQKVPMYVLAQLN